MSFFPFFDPQSIATMSAYNVYRSTIDLGSAAQQTLFTTLPQMDGFVVTEVWLHIDSISPSPSQVTMSVGTVATPTSIVNAVNITPLVQFSAAKVTTVGGVATVATLVQSNTTVVFQSSVRPTSGSGTLFVAGFYAGARDGR